MDKVYLPRIRMIIPIWGSEYIQRWLDLTFAALRSEGNILYLNKNSEFELAILTMAADISYMRGDARFIKLTEGIRVRFIAMDEFFPKQGKTSYGLPLTLAYAKGILDLGESAVGCYVIIFNADVVVSSGSFKSVLHRIHEGYTAIGAPGLRAIDGHARTALYERVDKKTNTLSISSRELMELANENLHGTVGSRIINEIVPIDTFYFHQLYWRISDDCIASRCFLLHPLCFQIELVANKVLCPVDYGFITEMCPNARFCVLHDSDEFMALELQAQDSEGHLLKLANKGETLEQRLLRLSDEITDQVATWTTAEHRRNAKSTIYFHTKDLPIDISQRVAPFELFVDTVLKRLPYPVSHIGHYQWLPAVKNYRKDMSKERGNTQISFLEDSRNLSPIVGGFPMDVVPRAERHSPEPFLSKQLLLPESVRYFVQKILICISVVRKFMHRNKLNALIKKHLLESNASLEVIYLDNIRGHVKKPNLSAKVIHHLNSSILDGGFIFSGELLQHFLKFDGSEAVLIYAPAGILSVWNRLNEDIERFSFYRRQVILVLIQQDFGLLNIAAHSYMLSILLSSFPSRKYDLTIDVYPSSGGKISCMFRALFRLFVNLINSKPSNSLELDPPPEYFSALVVSAKQRTFTR